jgi:hypothetical protein
LSFSEFASIAWQLFRMLTQLSFLQCDGKLPACSQCVFSKRDCEGYPDVLFVPFISSKPKVRKVSPKGTSVSLSSQPRPARVSSSSDSTSFLQNRDEAALTQGTAEILDRHQTEQCLSNTEEMVSLILSSYVPPEETGLGDMVSPRICGSWVTALRGLSVETTGSAAECLHSATTTLALSIIAYRTRDDFFQVASNQYENSIHHLVQNIAVAGNCYNNELVAAVMCLALSEVSLTRAPIIFRIRLFQLRKRLTIC